MNADINVRPFSAMIDNAIWDALDRRWKSGTEAKRVHLERALLTYLEPGDFKSEDQYRTLSEKYGTNQ